MSQIYNACGRGSRRRGIRHAAAAFLLWITVSAGLAQQGTITNIKVDVPPKKGKPRPPVALSCWLPADCKYVRGVIVASGQITKLATGSQFRKLAAEEDLGTLVLAPFPYDGTGAIKILDKVFDEWARKTGHPELRGAPILTAGLSASVIAARNVAYVAPDRVFGTVHIAGGNLHQRIPEGTSLSGVPFLAIDGQLEECGPEGPWPPPWLAPHLLRETQWYCIREAMLARRKKDPNHLFGLVVVPGGGHGSWNANITAMFIRKAAQRRIPKEKRDGSTPAKCIKLTAEDGWLTDGNLKHPTHEPASWSEYKGDKTWAFWYFDEELAKAVHKYHRFRPPGLLEKIWPLGERMSIPFSGDKPQDRAKAVRTWMAKRWGRKPDDLVVSYMAASIANRLRTTRDGKPLNAFQLEFECRKATRDICHTYDDVYSKIEQVIDEAKLPAAFKPVLKRHYADWTLSPGRPRSSGVAPEQLRRTLAGIPAGAKLIDARNARTPDALLSGVLPEFKKLSPISRRLIMEALTELNPCLSAAESFRLDGKIDPDKAPASTVNLTHAQMMEPLYALDPDLRPKGKTAELPTLTLSMPLGAGDKHVYRYRIGAEGLVLVPPAETLKAWANPKSLDLRNTWVRELDAIEDMTPVELNLAGCGVTDLTPLKKMKSLKRLVLSDTPVESPAPLTGLKLERLEVARTAVSDLTPLKGMPLQYLDLSGSRVKDLSPLKGMKLKELVLNEMTSIDLAPLKSVGVESIRLSLDCACKNPGALASIAGLKHISDVPVKDWLAVARKHQPLKKTGKKPLLPLPARSPESKRLAPQAAWPRPAGSAAAVADAKLDLVDSPAHMRKAWTSEARLPPTAVSAPWRTSIPWNKVSISGGFGSPTVAGGKVYVAYYVPRGPDVAEKTMEWRQEKREDPVREKWYVDADDVVVCMDAGTGKTLWKRALVGQGYNLNDRGSDHSCALTPSVADGRLYLLGSRGVVHALDTESGKVLWSSGIGSETIGRRQVADACRESGRIEGFKRRPLGAMTALGSSIVASDHRRWAGSGAPIGFDAVTGAIRWYTYDAHVPPTPVAWGRAENRCIVLQGGGRVRGLDPKTGKALWQTPANAGSIMALGASRMVCRSGQATTAYSIKPKGPVKIWEWPQEKVNDSAPAVLHRDHLYLFITWSETIEEEKVEINGIVCADAKTGKLLSKLQVEHPESMLIAAGERLIAVGPRCETLAMYDTDPKRFGPIGPRRPVSLAQGTRPAFADGRLFMRGDGRITCYELRRAPCYVQKDETASLLNALSRGPMAQAAEAALMLEHVAPALVDGTIDALVERLKKQDDNRAQLTGNTFKVLVARSKNAAAREKAVRALVPWLKKGKVESRTAMIGILGAFGPLAKPAVPDLQQVYLEKEFRDPARAALQKITGKEKIVVNPKMDDIGGGDDDDGLGLDL